MTTEDFHRKLTAILSADVVGYSKLMGDDEAATVKTLETYKGVMFSLIRQHRGRVVDSPGDNLLADFGSVVDAVQCGVSIQKELQTRNAELPENRKMAFRIGINLGDVIEEGERIYGDGVNIAARLEALADPGGICVSKTAFDQIESKLPFGYSFIGEQTVKNITKPVGAYKVLMETRLIDEGEQKAKAPFWRKKSVLSIRISLILAIAVVLYWNFYPREASIELTSIEEVPATVNVEDAPNTIAVLPFDDLSPENDQEYFVAGLSEEIINSLAQIPELKVTGKTSSFSFKGSNKTVQEIAAVLGVENILEGSVRKAGNDLRITAQLLRAEDGFHLFSKTYDRKLENIFDIQEDIAKAVAEELKIRLGIEGPPIKLGGTNNVEAYENYLITKGFAGQGSFDDITAVSLERLSIDAAISLDPEFALAWAYKARIHNYLAFTGPVALTSAEIQLALYAASRAIKIEPNLASGYYWLGAIKTGTGDFVEAGSNFQKALKLTTETFWETSITIGVHYFCVGYFKKAYETIKAVQVNDPLNTDNSDFFFLGLDFLGERQRAEEEYKRYKAAIPADEFSDYIISLIRLGEGELLSEDKIVYPSPIFNAAKENLASPEEGLSELHLIYNNGDNLSISNYYDISVWAAYFGDSEFAIDAIEIAHNYNSTNLYLVWLPIMHDVRQLPRFKEFIREIGLVDYWNQFGWPDICRPTDDGDFVCD